MKTKLTNFDDVLLIEMTNATGEIVTSDVFFDALN